jgi:hypothetical protein
MALGHGDQVLHEFAARELVEVAQHGEAGRHGDLVHRNSKE